MPRKRPKLREGAYPHIFPNLPERLSGEPSKKTSSRRDPEARKRRLEDQDNAAFSESLNKDTIPSFDDFKKSISEKLPSNGFA